MSDLFSVFDYYAGSGGFISCVAKWHGGLFLLFYLCCFVVFFFDCGDAELIFVGVMDTFVKNIFKEAKICSGTPHILATLLSFLVSENLMGILAYSFPLSAHVVVSMSLAFPMWLMSFCLNFNTNLRMGFIKSVSQGNSFMTSFIVVVSDCISILIRPVTLSVRLSLNAMIGNVLMKTISSCSLGVLFPFSNSVLVGIICSVLMVLVTVAEVCLMSLQGVVFCGLVISYISEVILKPE